jgi:hypothetical protein
MKKTFTHEYIKENKGCYDNSRIEELLKTAPQEITIENIANSTIPLIDKFWFVCNKCELTKEQSVEIAVNCAEIVLPIFEEKYPDNKSVRECIEATKLFMTGHITVEQLLQKRKAAAYAAANAAANAAAVYAYAAYAAYAADAAYTNAAAYAYVAGDSKYIQQLFDFLLTFIKNN